MLWGGPERGQRGKETAPAGADTLTGAWPITWVKQAMVDKDIDESGSELDDEQKGPSRNGRDFLHVDGEWTRDRVGFSLKYWGGKALSLCVIILLILAASAFGYRIISILIGQ